MLKNFIKGIKEALPAVGGIIGYSVAGPLGAGIGSGIGSLAAGKDVDDSFRNALIGGSLGYAGQTYFGRNPDSNFLGIGNFFREGTIPGVSNIVKPFGQRGAESSFAKMANLTAPKATVAGKPEMTLEEFINKRVTESGATDKDVIKLIQENAYSDYQDMKNKFDVSDFFMNNAGYIIPGAIAAYASGAMDEDDIELPTAPEAGSQGQLQTGVANLVNPILNPDGSYTYPVKDGGIMTAAKGRQVEYDTNPKSPTFGLQIGDTEKGLTDRQKELLKMLEEQRMQEILEMMQKEKFKMDQFQNPKIVPTGPGKGVLTIGAAQGRMMDGSISNFKENSPRRDLFLEREGPISDDRGSPNKDTVYAKLADGEFVVNADTVADIGYGMGATSLDQAKEMGGSFFYGLQDAQKKGILGNMVGMA